MKYTLVAVVAFELQPISSNAQSNVLEACSEIYKKIDRSKFTPLKINLASYNDPFTLPQTKIECTGTYDTGIPDPSTCSTEWDDCASKIDLPFGGWTCVPGTTTRCTNIIACNTWQTSAKDMECDLLFELKLPQFVAVPLAAYDKYGQAVQDAMPVACLPEDQQAIASKAYVEDNKDSIDALFAQDRPPDNPIKWDPLSGASQYVRSEIEKHIKAEIENRIRKAVEDWLTNSVVTAIATSVASGGTASGASIVGAAFELVAKVYSAVEPVLSFIEDTEELAEDVGIRTSCGWGDWRPL